MDWTAHTKATAMIQQHLSREVGRLGRNGVDDDTIRAQLRVLVERALRNERIRMVGQTHERGGRSRPLTHQGTLASLSARRPALG